MDQRHILDGDARSRWKAFSEFIGWIYIILWSASYYPQPLLNYRRRSTIGLSLDHYIGSVFASICFVVNTTLLMYSPDIRDQYAQRHQNAPHPSVRFNDFAYSLNALFITVVVLSQFIPALWGFDVGKRTRPSTSFICIMGSCIVALVGTAVRIGLTPASGKDPATWCWLDLVVLVGQLKIVISIAKYMPQAWLNYKRQSTVGLSMEGILMDLFGGFLSLGQLVIDCTLEGDWREVTSNPVKFGMGNVSILAALVYMWQHYVLYRKAEDDKPAGRHSQGDDEVTPLLGDQHEELRR